MVLSFINFCFLGCSPGVYGTREENFEIQQVVEELIRDINSLDMNERPDRIKGANEMDIEYSTQSETEKVKKYSTDTPSPIDRTASANRKLSVNLNFFFICLSLASFSFFVYTCIIKNYYYGYSFISFLADSSHSYVSHK